MRVPGSFPGPCYTVCGERPPRLVLVRAATSPHVLAFTPRFAHQFLDPGTYVFQDNRLPESMAVVLVKEKGMACGPGRAAVQPSSPYELARHGVRRHRPPNLGPNWTAITGMDPDRRDQGPEESSSVSSPRDNRCA